MKNDDTAPSFVMWPFIIHVYFPSLFFVNRFGVGRLLFCRVLSVKGYLISPSNITRRKRRKKKEDILDQDPHESKLQDGETDQEMDPTFALWWQDRSC